MLGGNALGLSSSSPLIRGKRSILLVSEGKSPFGTDGIPSPKAVSWQNENESVAFVHLNRATHLTAACRKIGRGEGTERTVKELAVADGGSLATVTLRGTGQKAENGEER